MGRIKKNQHVVVFVEKDNFKTTGVVTEIRKGTFDKSSGKYTVDIYVVRDDANGDSIYCNKCDLKKIDNSQLISQSKKNTEEVYQKVVQVGDRVVTVVGVRKEVKNNDKKTKKVRQLSFGHSICHPTDTFSEQEGYQMAYNRAKRTNKGTRTTCPTKTSPISKRMNSSRSSSYMSKCYKAASQFIWKQTN